MKLLPFVTVALLACAPALAFAQEQEEHKVTLHGSVQSDILFPQEDTSIGTGTYDSKVLTNTYADLQLQRWIVDAGARFEFNQYPLPGFEPNFKGWGVPHLYVRGHYKGTELTVGDFYEQFGSGFLLRTYEERTLGIDNALRGARLKMASLKGVVLKALFGAQRQYWKWSTDSWVCGGDLEINFDEYCKAMQAHNFKWSLGGSYVMKREKDENILVPETNYRLNLPMHVHGYGVRTQIRAGGFNILAETAFKTQDPSFDNNYTYQNGSAYMLSLSYSKKGISALAQVKRSENMSFRSQRSVQGTSLFINNMPAFAYQHTYALAALYPYATQAAPGEWAFQGEFGYTIPKKTALGGKYGTKLKLNFSHIRGLDKTPCEKPLNTIYGTDGDKSSFFGMGELYYQDINLQIEKKFTKDFKLNFMYMNQMYNKNVIEGHGETIKSNIFVLDGKYQFNKRFTLRMELQYLTTRQDEGDWAYGLAELSVMPYLMFSISDQWNVGETKLHYYMAQVVFNYKAHRLMAGYGRTRAGYNCSVGVCRYVPASRGFQMAYNFNF